MQFNINTVVEMQTQVLEKKQSVEHNPNSNTLSLEYWLFENHRFNTLLWQEEDLARRTKVADSEIANNKRAIDGFNQKRNDAIERIDDLFLQHITTVATVVKDAHLNSETLGSMCDRLSILSLKIYHMHLQTLRTDVNQAHVEACSQKVTTLKQQQSDLMYCANTLWHNALKGKAYFKIYRQFKMYNDKTLNPQMVKEQ